MTITDDNISASLATRFMQSTDEVDPVKWAKNVMKIDLWSKQREILRLLEIVPKLAVPSCHDAGKSFIASLATARWLAKWPPGTARVVTTAPTNTQVRAILWNEINSLHGGAKNEDGSNILPGRVNQTEWWIGGYMAGLGRKPSDYAPGTFQGLHAEHILIILDEAGAIPNELWNGVDTLATNTGAVILAIGNPDDPQAEFARIVKHAEEPDEEGRYNGWTVVKIPAWETPNLSGEQVPAKLRNVLLSRDWVEDKRVKWGEDSALWASKIAAEFPLESGMSVVRLGDVTIARAGGLDDDDDTMNGSSRRRRLEDVQLGVDIAASETGDETIIRERRGRRVLRRWSVRSGEPEDVSDLIVKAQEESGATMIHIDATGVGFGFIADIRRRIPGVSVQPFVAAAQAVDSKQYENRRAEAHWYVREALRHRLLDFSELEDADDAMSQLTSIRYRIKKGRIIVEPKDEVRKRIGRSPDDSDAILIAILPPGGTFGPAQATVHATSKKRTQEAATVRAQSPNAAPLVSTAPRAVPERVMTASRRGLGRSRRSFTLTARPH